MEIWKPVKDFEQQYEVSNYGRIKRILRYNVDPKILKQSVVKGYARVTLCKNNAKYAKNVHQVVAAAFIEGFNYGDMINHIDGNKLNNNVDNLEKTTYSLNNSHAFQTGLRTPVNKVSKYFGVHYVNRKYKKRDGTYSIYVSYKAMIRINGIKVFIKECKSEIEAAKAYDEYLNSIGNTTHTRNFS